MRNPVFKEKSKIKENIIFCIYKKNDILGLGETVDYKIQTNIFTTKSLSNNTELIFIPREIFKALLSSKFIYDKCGNITEEKTRILGNCIDKYKSIFEKRIELLLNNKKVYQRIKIFNTQGQNFGNIIKTSGFNIRKIKYMTGSSYITLNKNINSNKSQNDENDKNNISHYEKSLALENNEVNNNINKNEENNKDFLMKKKIIKNKNHNNFINSI